MTGEIFDMKVEILFNEICNLYGDGANARYLQQSLPEAEFYFTSLNEVPHFVKEEVNLIYMGSMPEHAQEWVINRLLPYRQRLIELIQHDTVFLFTGNAFEVFGSSIKNEDGSQIEGLHIYDGYAERTMMKRYNALFLGEISDEQAAPVKIVGFKNQFTHTYMDNQSCYAFKCLRGCGINPQSMLEGIRIHNFFGTYLVGPLLVLNPLFTKYLLRLAGEKDPHPAFEEVAMKAYQVRLAEFEDPKRKIIL